MKYLVCISLILGFIGYQSINLLASVSCYLGIAVLWLADVAYNRVLNDYRERQTEINSQLIAQRMRALGCNRVAPVPLEVAGQYLSTTQGD